MRSGVLAILSLAALCVFACTASGPQVLVTTPPSIDQAPPPKDATLEIGKVGTDWTPVMIGGNHGEMLTRALQDRSSVMLLLGRGLKGAAWEDRVFQMIKAASPDTSVVARKRATLDRLMEERGEIPYRVTMQPAGTDVLRRPFYLPKEHMINTDWLSKKKAMKGADALLTVRTVTVDDRKLRQLRERRRGSCATVLSELQGSMSSGRRMVEPFAAEADKRLERAFSDHLAGALPAWLDEIARAREGLDSEGTGASCLDEYESFLGKYRACVDGTCAVGPRFHALGGGVIAMDMGPSNTIPDRCPLEGVKDYSALLNELAARVSQEVSASLGDDWAGDLARFGALERLATGMEKVCTPRHRRWSEIGLREGRSSVSALVDELAAMGTQGEWMAGGGQEWVPGVGSVRVLSRVVPSGADPRASVEALLKTLRGHDRCSEGVENLLQVSLIDVGTSEVVFMSIFFEEQLFCEDLPPGQP